MTFKFSFFLYFIFTSTISARIHEYKGLYCYHDILNFVQSNASCDFDITQIGIKMLGNSARCSDKCMLLSKDIHIYQSFYFRVTNISVTLHIKSEKYTFNLESHHCSEKEINKIRLDIVCGSPIRPGESFIACTKEVACLDDRAECQYLTNGGQGRCVCEDHSMLIKGQVCECNEGQIRYKDTCLDGGRGLNESCTFDVQCNATDGAGQCRLNEMMHMETCQCSRDYLLIDGKCRKTNKSLNMTCIVSEQCTATIGAGHCAIDGENKVCHCSKNYEFVNGTCLKGKKRLGESCSFSKQCSGSENAGNCKNSALSGNFIQEKSCQCDDNFLQILGLCLPSNLSVGDECYLSSQCSSTKHADQCIDGYCLCQEGFLLKEQRCLPGTLLLGESCDFDEQCSGTKNAGNCKYVGGVNFTTSKHCDCDDGFSNFRGDCLPGNLSVGQVCFRSSQCTHADPATRCADGHCLCMEGYQMRGRKCVEDTNKENARTQKVEDISIIAGITGYFLGLASSICASVVFKKIWKRSIKTRYRNTPIPQSGSNLALQNVLYKHSESAVCVCESLVQIQGIRKNSKYNNDPYSSIEETYNHLNDNTDLTPTNEVYDFAGHIETDQSEDTYSLAKTLPSSKNGCQC